MSKDFFHQIGAVQRFHELYQFFEGVHFFAKDLNSRFAVVGKELADRLGASSEANVLGSTDFDYFPSHVAEKFVRDDEFVIHNGQPLLDRVEMMYTEEGLLDLFITNKLPVYDEQNRIVGVMGFTRSYEGSRPDIQMHRQLNAAIDYIRERIDSTVCVAELAEVVGVSQRHLSRRFAQYFGMGVREFILQTKIQSACTILLESDEPISQIANRFGFCDQSAFTRQFKKIIGKTPKVFRSDNRNVNAVNPANRPHS